MGAGSAGDWYIAFVSTRSNVAVSGVSGGGLTWSLVAEQCGARGQVGMDFWAATGAGTAGAVTATFGATCNGSNIVVSRYTGADVADVDTSWNTLGEKEACTGGTDNNDATGSITTATADSLVAAGFCTRNRTLTDTGGDWTTRAADIAGGSGGDLVTSSVETRATTTAGSYTAGGANNMSGDADWVLMLVALPPTAAAGTAVPNALMMVGSGT